MKKIPQILYKFLIAILEFLETILRAIGYTIYKVFIFILSYPLAFTFIIIVVYFIVSHTKDFIHYRRCARTQFMVRHKFGHTIYISAPIRTGKTTLLSALAHLYTLILSNLASGSISKISNMMLEVDFEEVNKLIESCYADKIPSGECSEIVIQNNPVAFSKVKTDPVDREIRYSILIKDYVEAYYAVLTNNYIFAAKETPFYNRITENYRKRFDFTSMQLKNAYDSGIFQLDNYNIILEDEKGLDGIKKESKYMQASSADDGVPEFLRIIGNAGKETLYYITTNQQAKRWLSTERQLMNTNIFIEEMEIIESKSFYRTFLRLFNRIINIFYSIFIFFHFTKLSKKMYTSRPNFFRTINAKLALYDRQLFAKNYIKYIVRIYANVDDVGKENSNAHIYYENMELYFPLIYCFGNINTHEYAFIFDALRQHSKVNLFTSAEDTAVLSDEEKDEVVHHLLNRPKKEEKKETVDVSKGEEDIPPPSLD